MAGSRAPAAGMRSRISSRGCTGWPRRRGATPRRCPPRCSAPRRKKGRCANTRRPASTARCSRSRTRAPTRSCASSTATSRCSLDRDGSVGWVERSETHPRFRGHVMRLSSLDDYQGVALDMADWAPVHARGIEIAVERFPFADADDVVRSLADSEIVAAMRERTPFPRSIVERLPKLKLLITTGMRNASFDMAALRDRGVTVCGTGGPGGGNEDTAERAWGLILGAARRIAEDHAFMRHGGWQTRVGYRVAGKTLGLLGLGRLGSAVARVGLAFGMKAIAWSQNLTAEKAAAQGVERVEKDERCRRSDSLSVQLVRSDPSRGTGVAVAIGLMKPSAILINTSRGPICDTEAVIAALEAGRLAYAGFDVYDKEPLPIDHPLRQAPNVILTPHIGYVTDENYHSSYPQIVENVLGFLDGKPVRVI